MHWNYRCPECRAMLNPDRTIILVAVSEGKRVLVGFHPEPGNYEIYLPPGTATHPGSRWDFSCPVCNASLATPDNDNLCALVLEDEGGPQRVLFSRVAGEQVTLVVGRRGVVREHGTHVEAYVGYARQMKYM